MRSPENSQKPEIQLVSIKIAPKLAKSIDCDQNLII